MNFRTKIKQLEKTAQIKTRIYCRCFDKHHEALLNKTYGEPFNASDIVPDTTPLEGICHKCRNPINPQVKWFYSKLGQIYGERFIN